MKRTLAIAVQNKHTSIAALVYLLGKFGAMIAGVWLPAHKEQFDATAGIIEAAAVAYGLFAAGDGAKGLDPATVKSDKGSQ